MITRRYTCQDLRDNSIDIDAIGTIAKDCGKYHIYGLKFWMERYTLHKERLPRRVGLNKSSVEVLFSKVQKEDGTTKTTLDGKIRFFSRGYYYTVRMLLSAEAVYEFRPYDIKIQSYLYTYFAHVIENDVRIQKYRIFSLPDDLSNYTPGAEWVNQEIQQYHWMDYWNSYPTKLQTPLTLRKVERENPVSGIFRLINSIKK